MCHPEVENSILDSCEARQANPGRRSFGHQRMWPCAFGEGWPLVLTSWRKSPLHSRKRGGVRSRAIPSDGVGPISFRSRYDRSWSEDPNQKLVPQGACCVVLCGKARWARTLDRADPPRSASYSYAIFGARAMSAAPTFPMAAFGRPPPNLRLRQMTASGLIVLKNSLALCRRIRWRMNMRRTICTDQYGRQN